MNDGPNRTEYSSAAGRFKIHFSGVPKEIEETQETNVGTLVSHTVLFVKDIAESVSYRDYPGNLELPNSIKRVLDDARDRGLTPFANEELHILSETNVSVEGHPGRLVHVEAKDQILRFKILVVANRMYVLMLRSSKRPRAQSEYEKTGHELLRLIRTLDSSGSRSHWNLERILIHRGRIQDHVSRNSLPNAVTISERN